MKFPYFPMRIIIVCPGFRPPSSRAIRMMQDKENVGLL